MRRYPRNPGRAERSGITAADVDPEQLRLGTEHELEHTDDRREARRIALDHLAEDPRYYTHLSACESRYTSNAALRLWRFNRGTGLWNVARDVTEETAQQWLDVWQREEPGEYFKISRSEPRVSPISEKRHRVVKGRFVGNGSAIHDDTLRFELEQLVLTWRATGAQRDLEAIAPLLQSAGYDLDRVLYSDSGSRVDTSTERTRGTVARKVVDMINAAPRSDLERWVFATGTRSAQALLREPQAPALRRPSDALDPETIRDILQQHFDDWQQSYESGGGSVSLYLLKPVVEDAGFKVRFGAEPGYRPRVYRDREEWDLGDRFLYVNFLRAVGETIDRASTPNLDGYMQWVTEVTGEEYAENGVALSSNGSGYYVWALAKGSNTPLSSEGPWGSYELTQAKYFARIGATEGVHDRIVTRGLGSDIVRRYRAGSGERLI